MIEYNNFVTILSSPSGAGKSTIVKKLLNWEGSNLEVSISATTREPRGEEIDGVHYHFLTKEDFEKKIEENAFIEYAKVFDNYYGTLKSEINSKFTNKKDVILDIDWQGARQVSDILDNKTLLKIFILPPSIVELENRLRSRGEDSEETIQKRMSRARDEISHFNEYDYIIINDNIEKAFEEIKSIIISKRLNNVKQNSLEEFVNNI